MALPLSLPGLVKVWPCPREGCGGSMWTDGLEVFCLLCSRQPEGESTRLRRAGSHEVMSAMARTSSNGRRRAA